MRKSYTLLLAFIFLFFNVYRSYSQTKKIGPPSKGINFHLNSEIQKKKATNESINLLVKGNTSAIQNFVIAQGGTFKYSANGIAAISIPSDKVRELGENIQPLGIQKIEFNGNKGAPLNDTMLTNTKAESVHLGLGDLCQGYDGEGVILGYVDTGIDFNHPDFKNADGSSRILFIWDQTFNGPNKPAPYNYGQEWTKANIDAGTCTHVDPATWSGHGSHVSGVGSGNGLATGKYKGIAPKTEIIMVSTNFNASAWTNTVADGIDYIFKKADALGKPCVVNTSVGSLGGSHDGKDLAAQLIDGLITAKSGRAVVAAAGNSGNSNFHLGYNVSPDTNFTWFSRNSSLNFGPYAPSGAVYFDLYADTADFNNVKFSVGVDKTSPSYSFRGATSYKEIKKYFDGTYAKDAFDVYTDTVKNSLGQRIGIMHIYAEEDQGTYHMEVIVNPVDSISNYNWRFSTTGSGRFDLWASASLIGGSNMVTSLPSSATFPPIDKYRMPDYLQTMVSSWPCSPKVITVGNYHNRNSYPSYTTTVTYGDIPGSIRASSSAGPSRTGTVKPDLAAPGTHVLSVARLADIATWKISDPTRLSDDGMHRIGAGTSQASPMVAGTAALYFQKNPNATFSQLKNDLISSAYADSHTGPLPNSIWGNGKLDALATMEASGTPPKPVATINTDKPNGCLGSDVVVTASPAGGTGSYIHSWSGDTAQVDVKNAVQTTLNSSTVNSYTLIYTVRDSLGCEGSVNVTIDVLENPVANMGTFPLFCQDEVINLDGNPTGGTTIYAVHTWTGDVANLTSTTSQTPDFESSITGDYSLTYTVTDDKGCQGFDTKILTVMPKPTSTVSGGGATCSGDSIEVSLTFTGTPPFDYSLYDGTNTIFGTADSVYSSFFSQTNGFYTIIDVNDLHCFNDQSTGDAMVIINPTPSAPMLSNDTSYCDNEFFDDMVATANVGGTISWYDALQNLLYTGSNYTPDNVIGVSEYHVTEILNGCESAESVVSIEIRLMPSVPLAAVDTLYCDNENYSDMVVNALSGGTINWYDEGQNLLHSGSSFSPLTLLGVTAYYTTEELNGCESLSSMTSIEIKATPSAPLAGSDTSYCLGSQLDDMISTIGFGGIITWYADSDLQTFLSNADKLTPTDSVGTTSYYVTETLDGCQSDASVVSVTINALPSQPSIDQAGNVLSTSSIAASYQWYLDGSPIAAANSSSYTASQNGVYHVEVQDNNGCGNVSDSLNITISSVAVANTVINFNLYPNPFNGAFKAEISNLSSSVATITVLDVIGRIVFSKEIEKKIGQNSFTVDLQEEAKGVYFFRIQDGENTHIRKIIHK